MTVSARRNAMLPQHNAEGLPLLSQCSVGNTKQPKKVVKFDEVTSPNLRVISSCTE